MSPLRCGAFHDSIIAPYRISGFINENVTIFRREKHAQKFVSVRRLKTRVPNVMHGIENNRFSTVAGARKIR
jgi:hypothetical protein